MKNQLLCLFALFLGLNLFSHENRIGKDSKEIFDEKKELSIIRFTRKTRQCFPSENNLLEK
ncbi:hypothetical protein SDC9_117009 [bioreactor metagenome]|uniref:Uncharacterized protein n=1 Tax=bioreactor metagenome TaxID=1076179 RepID=A0A645BY73_9ZZZZ